MKKSVVFLTAPALLAAALPAQGAPDHGLSLTIGAEYATGDYGTRQDTDSWYLPVTVKYEGPSSSVALTVPYVFVDGPGTVLPWGGAMGGMGGGIRSGAGAGASRSENGLGDIIVTGSLNLKGEDRYGPRVDLTGKAKFGTADRDERLGTGEDDLAVQVDLERNYGANSLFGSIGYKLLGNPPGVNYENVFFGAIGTAHRFSDTTSLGIALDAQEAALPGTPSRLEATVFLSSKADGATKITGYVLHGLRDGSPDWGAGILFKFSQ